MTKILEDQGMNKLYNPSVWNAASFTHQNNILEQLLYIKPNDFDKTYFEKGLRGALRGMNLNGMKMLLRFNSSQLLVPYPLPSELLINACEANFPQMVKILLSYGVNPNAKDIFCLKKIVIKFFKQ